MDCLQLTEGVNDVMCWRVTCFCLGYIGQGSSENVDGIDGHEESNHSPSTPEKQIQHRANTTMHVCWHRNTSVSMRDHERAIKVSPFLK